MNYSSSHTKGSMRRLLYFSQFWPRLLDCEEAGVQRGSLAVFPLVRQPHFSCLAPSHQHWGLAYWPRQGRGLSSNALRGCAIPVLLPVKAPDTVAWIFFYLHARCLLHCPTRRHQTASTPEPSSSTWCLFRACRLQWCCEMAEGIR